MTPWSVRPLHPAPGSPATAVTIHADDATAHAAVLALVQMLTATSFDDLKTAADRLEDAGNRTDSDAALAEFDATLDRACRLYGTDLTGLWRVRVGILEVSDFVLAMGQAFETPAVREGGAA